MALNVLRIVAAFAVFCASACGRPAPTGPPPEVELGTRSVTDWTDKTELFAEYAPLVAGRTSRFAIHLTRLDSFRALTEGSVEVRLRGAGGADEVFRVEGPSRPGIFGVDVTPGRTGQRELVIALRSTALDDEHRLGSVDVHANADAARAEEGDEGRAAPGISFLKEQQWSLDFGTAVVREQAVRTSLRVPAQLVERPGGAATVVAPIDGRLAQVLDAPLGSIASRGQELCRLRPPPAVPGDLPQLQRARAEAQSALGLAVRDRERAERLTTAGAAPEKRLDEAQAVEEQARARLLAAEATLAQYDVARAGGEATDANGLFIVRAPLSGVIARREAVAGANVTAGTFLFRLVDPSQIHVVGQIPEAESGLARQVVEAEMEVPGYEQRVTVGRLVGVGKVLDADSRTLPITFAFDNRAPGLPIGQAVFLHLLMEPTAPRPVVPAAAIVDDAGRPIVFVQIAGETFERRPVTLGARAGELVQIAEGVKPGERVVTKGAYLVRLASLSTSVPAHGHVH